MSSGQASYSTSATTYGRKPEDSYYYIDGTRQIPGPVKIAGDLEVTGTTKLDGNVSALGNVAVANQLQLGAGAYLANQGTPNVLTNVGGVAALSVTSTAVNSLVPMTVAGTLGVTGVATLSAGAIMNRIQVAGLALQVEGNVSVVAPAGFPTLNSLSVDGSLFAAQGGATIGNGTIVDPDKQFIVKRNFTLPGFQAIPVSVSTQDLPSGITLTILNYITSIDSPFGSIIPHNISISVYDKGAPTLRYANAFVMNCQKNGAVPPTIVNQINVGLTLSIDSHGGAGNSLDVTNNTGVTVSQGSLAWSYTCLS